MFCVIEKGNTFMTYLNELKSRKRIKIAFQNILLYCSITKHTHKSDNDNMRKSLKVSKVEGGGGLKLLQWW